MHNVQAGSDVDHGDQCDGAHPQDRDHTGDQCFHGGCTEDLHLRRNGNRCVEMDHCHPAGPAAGHCHWQHLGEGPHRRPPGFQFFADRDHSMAGYRGGFLGHCQFSLDLESFSVDGERGAGI